MITVENADKVLKDYYLDAISSQLNDHISPFYSAIEKNTNHVVGKDVSLTVIRENARGITACSEDGDLPAPYKNRYLNITVPLKNLYGTIEISDKALRASRDKSGAFVNLLDAEMEGLVQSAKQDFRRMLFGDGTGVLFKIENSSGSNAYSVDHADLNLVGKCVDIYPSAAPGMHNDVLTAYIVDIDPSGRTVTFDRDLNEFTMGATVTGATAYAHDGKDGELTGLAALFDNDTVYGYDKFKETYFKPYIANANGPVNEEALCDVIDYLDENFNSTVNIIICSYKTKKKIAAFVADKKHIVNSIDVHTGVGTVTVNGITVYADKFCPDDRIYFLNTDDFSLNQLCDWEWLEDKGGKILKQVPGKAAYRATLVKYAELICKKPCGQGMLMISV